MSAWSPELEKEGQITRRNLFRTPGEAPGVKTTSSTTSVSEMEGLLRRAGFEVLAVTDLYDSNGVGYRAGQPSYDVLARRR